MQQTTLAHEQILRHNNILHRYLPVLLYLPSTNPFYASISKGAASTCFTLLGDFKNNASISLINVYRLSKADLLLYPLFSLEKKGILISCQSRSVVRLSVRLSVRVYVRPSRFL